MAKNKCRHLNQHLDVLRRANNRAPRTWCNKCHTEVTPHWAVKLYKIGLSYGAERVKQKLKDVLGVL